MITCKNTASIYYGIVKNAVVQKGYMVVTFGPI